MARIRTIKPEFPQSESTGKLSRDARLLFVQLWTLADDEGRARAASRMLASLLYPYDDDAKDLMEGWLVELAAHGCIRRYVVEGSSYLEIVNWLKHQKIDKPSKSRLPSFDDASRQFAKPREPSPADLGPRTVDPGPSEANASGGEPPDDPRTRLFNVGLKTLANITGKTPDSCRSQVGRWLKAANDEAIHVLAAIEGAERNRVADPVAWIERVLTPKPKVVHAKTGLGATLARLRDDIAADERSQERGRPPPRLLSNG
jgi:hypothetical protein